MCRGACAGRPRGPGRKAVEGTELFPLLGEDRTRVDMQREDGPPALGSSQQLPLLLCRVIAPASAAAEPWRIKTQPLPGPRAPHQPGHSQLSFSPCQTPASPAPDRGWSLKHTVHLTRHSLCLQGLPGAPASTPTCVCSVPPVCWAPLQVPAVQQHNRVRWPPTPEALSGPRAGWSERGRPGTQRGFGRSRGFP